MGAAVESRDMDVEAAVETMAEFLVDYRDEADAEGYVLGVSGGLDSAVATTLAVRAVGADAVTGLVLPGAPSDPANMADARDLCASLGIDYRETSIRPIVAAVTDAAGATPSRETVGNVRARVRMVLLYQAANERNLLVCGAGNKSERLLGYFTKYGDGATDVAPMAGLYKTEVADVARHLDLDPTFVEKTPTAGLWPGQTDEEELGADYDAIDDVLIGLVEREWSAARVAEETGVDVETVRRFEAMRRESAHKRGRPPSPDVARYRRNAGR